jgi:hypothetical protein
MTGKGDHPLSGIDLLERVTPAFYLGAMLELNAKEKQMLNEMVITRHSR